MSRITTKKYFREKFAAVDLINLVDYLNKNEITEKKLKDDDTVSNIIRLGMRKVAKTNHSTIEIDEFRKTILSFKIDDLKKTNLYRINRGILVVACVERLLCPGKTDEEYREIYNYRKPSKMYKKLCKLQCNIPIEHKLGPAVVKSAKIFFGNRRLAKQNGILQTIRAYLKKIDINSVEMEYIKNESFRIINGTESNKKKQMWGTLMDQEYFEKKFKADVLINLVNYLVKRDVKEEDLKKRDIIMDILREGIKKFVDKRQPPSKLQLREFQNFLTAKVDYLKVSNLYRINHGILSVACVEHVLYPGQDHEVYSKIYGGDTKKATKVYKKLCGFSKENNVNEATAKSAATFFRCKTFVNEDGCLKTIRSYLKKIQIGPEEKEYIKNASIKLINGNKASDAVQPPTNVTNHPISTPTDDEQQTHPPAPEVLSTNVDHRSTVSTPAANQRSLLSRYSPNDVVLAKRPRMNSYFWPAKIKEVRSDGTYAIYFLLSAGTEEVTSEEDVKAFTQEEIVAAADCLPQGLLLDGFVRAVCIGSTGG